MKIANVTRVLALALTVASVAVPASAHAASLRGIFHFHPSVPDTRIHYTVFNQADLSYQVRIAGKVYEVPPHHNLRIAAPVGTQVYAALPMHTHKAGELLHEIDANDNSRLLILD